ncbi:MAG: M56 family metallopeptidase, partial [Faecousia sp.]
GFIRPKIYIPMGLSPTVRKHILAHERTHLEKGDHWFKMIGFLALALHWFNPLVWIAYVLLCKDIELACDERVVQFMELEERKSYSAALLSCSTKQAHFAACPVAFGEVSVKERIKTVLNYRRPSFWISLLGVVAILFVAVCLLTNPAKEPDSPAAAATTQEQQSLVKCHDALEDLLSQQDYILGLTGSNEYPQWQAYLSRLGGDTLWQYMPTSSPDPTSGRMEYGGKHYAYQSGAWVETETADTQFEDYLAPFRWDLDDAILLSDTTEENWETIRFTSPWSTDSGTVETATNTYYFNTEGKLYRIDVQNAPNTNTTKVILDTDGWIADKTATYYFDEAIAAITEGTVSEVDLNQQAEFDAWGFNFRVDDDRLSDSGSDVYYSQSETGRGVLSTTDEYWLERKVGNEWEVVTPVNQPQWSGSAQGIAKGTSTYGYIDWTPIYGKLPTGTYRMGKTVTCRDESPRYANTHDFYSEFEIYSVVDSNSPEAAAAVERCYAGLEELKNRKSLHWKSVMGQDSDFENWLDGENLLRVTNWYLPDVDPEMISEHERTIAPRTDTWINYNGVGYGDVREDPEIPASKVLGLGVKSLSTSMKFNRFADDFNMSFFERSNHQISFPEGVGVVSDEMVRFVTSWNLAGVEEEETAQLTYRFDGNGNLKYMEYKSNLDDYEYIAFIEIYPDTAEEIDAKIQSSIQSLYVSSFSWKDAKAKYATDEFNHRDNGFVNNDMVSITNPVDAARRALKEYPNLGDYLSLDVAHDDDANMWRVTIKSYYSYQASDEYRDIYLDDNGVTHLLVYEGPIEYNQTRK